MAHGLWSVAVVALVAAVTLAPAPAAAQSVPDGLAARASVAPDLKFPTTAKKLGSFTSLDMAIFRPEGDGRHPAVVLHHTCSGVTEHLRFWTGELLKQGYVVFVLDSLGPRRIKSVCTPTREMSFGRGVKDAFDALAHVKTLPFVDPDRVALVGFSWGAIIAHLTSSDAVAAKLKATSRYAAAVSFYGHCWVPALPQFGTPEVEFLQKDLSRPTLLLMGEADTESPPSHCVRRLQSLKAAGAPVEWHVYPGATHCWDCAEYHGVRKPNLFFGGTIELSYSKGITEESAKQVTDFLVRQLKRMR
jgi:dienelactone hydrolase